LHGGFLFIKLTSSEAKDRCLQLLSDVKASGGVWSRIEAKPCTSTMLASRSPEVILKSNAVLPPASPNPEPLKRKREAHYGAKKRAKKILAKLLVCEGITAKACGAESMSLERIPFPDLLQRVQPTANNALVATLGSVPPEMEALDWANAPTEIDPLCGMQLAGRGGSKKRARRAGAEVSRAQRKRWQVESFWSILVAMDLPAGSRVVDFGSGSGNLVLALAHWMPNLKFVAVVKF
jgi:hypothetical protein